MTLQSSSEHSVFQPSNVLLPPGLAGHYQATWCMHTTLWSLHTRELLCGCLCLARVWLPALTSHFGDCTTVKHVSSHPFVAGGCLSSAPGEPG